MRLEGGPKDTLPPLIVAVLPEDYTANFAEKNIFIEFDEYVQIQDQQKEFFTSPQMKKTPQLSIRGRGVYIQIKDTLAENTTYALNFGSSIRDNNEGNPRHGLRYVFSTGPEIDSMVVSGYTEDSYKADSVPKSFIYFFPVDALDSLVLTRDYDSTMLKKDTMGAPMYRPAVIARAEPNGVFIAQNLKPIPYRIYAFEDTNSNMMYEPSIDKIGFIEEPQNPAELTDFGIWFDSIRMYVTAQPQLYFRMFTDETFKQQNLREQSRPRQHQAQLIFNAPWPEIDDIAFDSIPRDRVIVEPMALRRDTMALWFNMPGEELPDTIKGTITYRQWNDSLHMLVPATKDLRLAWRPVPETREQERERLRLEKAREEALQDSTEWVEPEKKTLFRSTFTPSSGTVTPETQLSIMFDMPLIRFDTASVRMREIVAPAPTGRSSYTRPSSSKEEKRDTVSIPIRWRQDTAQMRRWYLDVAWKVRNGYQLTIPKGAFEDIAREVNDSTTISYTGVDPDKTATYVVSVTGKTPDARYIVQLLSESGQVLQEKRDVQTGKVTFLYVNPGNVKFRVTEDANGNGKWDSGSLVERRQPERTEYYVNDEGVDVFIAKENWEFDDVRLDMNKIFAPMTPQRLWETLEARELSRLQRVAEERAKNPPRDQNQSSGMGFQMPSMGGMGSGSSVGY